MTMTYTQTAKYFLVALLIARSCNVIFSPIPDCDETFNYYEPLNFLLRGFGKRTWEYSPGYAIRSWAYLAPFYPLWPFASLLDVLGKQQVMFYTIRGLCAVVTTYAEFHMFITLQKYNKPLANWFILLSLTCLGLSHSSVALLPSSLAMNCALLSSSNFLKFCYTRSVRHALLVSSWLLIGGIFGWPFVLLLGLPSMLYIIYDLYGQHKCAQYVKWSISFGFIYLATSMEVDYFFYGKTVAVPLNIVLYNVLYADEFSGPNIFGTEPLSYYLKNLVLNFHVVAPLAAVSVFVIFYTLAMTRNRLYKGLLFGIVAPMWLWAGVFFTQPHKEERFMYPIYGLINLSGATTIHCALTTLNSVTHVVTKRRVAKLLNIIIVRAIGFTFITIGILRTVSFSKSYNTPLEVYSHIPQNASGNLCIGREWYRFPSSFFLPATLRAQFIHSGFNGLLPGDFEENVGLLKGVQNEPKGMNNKNEYDSGKIIDLSQCSYAVDISQPVVSEDEYSFTDNAAWELIYTAKFLDNENSKGLGKYLWLPKTVEGYTGTKLSYHDYNLYQKVL